MKQLFLTFFMLLFVVSGAFAIGENDDINALIVTGNAGIVVIDGNVDINQDSLQSASQVRVQSITFTGVTTVDADTVFFAEVTGGNVAILRIEATVTTATATTANMQLVGRYPLTGAMNTNTSMNADVDIDAKAIGSVFRWDLSNFGAVFSTTAIGTPIASGDIGEESCEVPINVKLGFETGETLGVDAIFDVEIWYMTNGTGEIIAATSL